MWLLIRSSLLKASRPPEAGKKYWTSSETQSAVV